jgi:hypothetical protein
MIDIVLAGHIRFPLFVRNVLTMKEQKRLSIKKNTETFCHMTWLLNYSSHDLITYVQ